MRALQIILNGKNVCIAGINGYSVLTAIITSHLPDPESEVAKLMAEDGKENVIDLSVGGLDVQAMENLTWLLRELKIGDEVTIKILETDLVDPPTQKNKLAGTSK